MSKRVRVVALVGALLLLLTACRTDEVTMIDSHRDGQFVDVAGSVEVTGKLDPVWPLGGTLTVDGVTTPYADAGVDPDRSWSATVPLVPGELVREVEVVYTAPNTVRYRQMIRLLVGPSIADDLTSFSPDGVGMRFTNEGLAGLGPVIQDLSSGSFDLNAMLVGQEIATDMADATIYEAGAGNITLAPTVTASGVRTVVVLSDLYLGIDLENVDIVGSCRLDVEIPSVTIDGYYDLASYGNGTGDVDVNLKGGTPGATDGQPLVTIPTVGTEFTSGSCDPDTILGPIVGSIAGDTSQMIRDSFGGQLGDPDGAGPADSPIADAVEQALAGISVAGPVGGAVGANLQAPLIDVVEDDGGMTFRSDANFGTVDPVTGQPTCVGHPEAPDLVSTADLPSGVPAFGATTPSGQPYGLGLGISSSAFNQMLGAMVECGLLNSTVTHFELAPGFSVQLTASVLKNLMPKFGDLYDAETGVDSIFEIRVRPTAAPFLTGEPGPNGEPAELMIANLALDFVQVGYKHGDGTVTDAGEYQDYRWMTIMIDAPFGFDLAFDEGAGELLPTLTTPTAAQVNARITFNLIQQPEATAEALFEQIFPSVASGMASSFAAFPLPSFMGLSIDVLEVAEADNVWMLYADLNAAETTKLENFAVVDQSTADYEDDSAVGNSGAWRHRIKKTWSSTGANVALQSNLGADGIAFNSYQAGARARYTVTFDVVPAEGKTWRIDLAHSIRGAFTCKDEPTGSCRMRFRDGLQGTWQDRSDNGTDRPVAASVQVGAGPVQAFNFTPNPSSRSGSGTNSTEFTGSNAHVITGTTPETVTVTVEFWQRAASICTFTLGTCAFSEGEEASIRLGLSDTLSNNFTAGEYPGIGNRVANTDGHFLSIALSEL